MKVQGWDGKLSVFQRERWNTKWPRDSPKKEKWKGLWCVHHLIRQEVALLFTIRSAGRAGGKSKRNKRETIAIDSGSLIWAEAKIQAWTHNDVMLMWDRKEEMLHYRMVCSGGVVAWLLTLLQSVSASPFIAFLSRASSCTVKVNAAFQNQCDNLPVRRAAHPERNFPFLWPIYRLMRYNFTSFLQEEAPL